MVVAITLSFDGTWHKRGFTSLYGVGVCIEVKTGLVSDSCVMSNYCHKCNVSEKSDDWREIHGAECRINHEGSSKSMEQEAVCVLWSLCVEKHRLRYVQMLSDCSI